MEKFSPYLGLFFLIAAAQGLFFSLAQVSSFKKVCASRVFLTLTVTCFSIALIESGLWVSGKMDAFVHFIYISQPIPFMLGPLVYLYFKTSFTKEPFLRKDFLHFMPFILYFLYCSQFYFSSGRAKEAMMDNEVAFSQFFLVRISSLYPLVLMSFSLTLYCVFIWKEFYQKTLLLKEVRSWFLLTWGIFVFYTLNFIVFHVLSINHLIGGCSDYGIASSMSIFIYLFAWFGFARPQVFNGYSIKEALSHGRSVRSAHSFSSEESIAALKTKLQKLMSSEKLYKNEDIRLDLLAQRLGVSRNNLSYLINTTGMNFFEFINHWRIEEAKKILAETTKQELNIIEVAFEVGFSNKVSFNKFFKKSTGVTPTEFRKYALQKR